MIEWKSRVSDNFYSVEFETDVYDLYKIIAEACSKAMDQTVSPTEDPSKYVGGICAICEKRYNCTNHMYDPNYYCPFFKKEKEYNDD